MVVGSERRAHVEGAMVDQRNGPAAALSWRGTRLVAFSRAWACLAPADSSDAPEDSLSTHSPLHCTKRPVQSSPVQASQTPPKPQLTSTADRRQATRQGAGQSGRDGGRRPRGQLASAGVPRPNRNSSRGRCSAGDAMHALKGTWRSPTYRPSHACISTAFVATIDLALGG